jgi:tRNA-dihydrouridine synthase 3
LHGRSREQRYTKEADWDYIKQCRELVPPESAAFIGNGDILTFSDYYRAKEASTVDTILIGRGALIKPWLFTEIKEERDWDISSGERLAILQKYANYALEHFGSDSEGVEKARSFMLEWISFLYR